MYQTGDNIWAEIPEYRPSDAGYVVSLPHSLAFAQVLAEIIAKHTLRSHTPIHRGALCSALAAARTIGGQGDVATFAQEGSRLQGRESVGGAEPGQAEFRET